ncbi:MAG: ferrochelatase [Gammaproteobacteria bacterium]|nr:ferrochelatase [Gammaproteobacteria bacterium]
MPTHPNSADFEHGRPSAVGLLLTNLGTPDAPTTAAVRRYLREFLSDPRVIEVARIPWWFILNFGILPLRPRRSAHAYARIWEAEGSPLLRITARQAQAVAAQFTARCRAPVRVEFAMRYGKPSLRSVLERLAAAQVRRLLVLPLYPQYSATTTGSTFDAVSKALRSHRWVPELRFVGGYHDDPVYIAALADSVREHWDAHGRGKRLLFSFHGLPREYLLAGDPYFCQCHATARLVAEALALPGSDWQVAFQSRFGPREWLRPYTDETLREWAGGGLGSVDVICPGFAADCLETLEEIAMLNRDLFLAAGGERFSYIPALNDSATHAQALTALALRHMRGWPELEQDYDPAAAATARSEAAARARKLGAPR